MDDEDKIMGKWWHLWLMPDLFGEEKSTKKNAVIKQINKSNKELRDQPLIV